MSSDLYIYGAGGLGREVRAMLRQMPEWKVAGFFDDRIPAGTNIDGISCFGGASEIAALNRPIAVVIAIGDPKEKMKLVHTLENQTHLTFPVLIHPTCQLLAPEQITVGRGSILTAGVVLTTSISIGNHVLINLNSTIGHDVDIQEGTSVMPGVNIAGTVTIGKEVLVGAGATVLNGLTIGDRATVGAGAVVTRHVSQSSVVVGVPARNL